MRIRSLVYLGLALCLLAGPYSGIRLRPAMTLTSDTLLGLAWYTFATCCSRRVFFPLLLNSELKLMACITILLSLDL